MKFRIEVKVSDFQEIVSNNLDSLVGYPGAPSPLNHLLDEEYLKVTQDIQKLADSFVHNEYIIVELDTDNRAARVLNNKEAHDTDYRIGMVHPDGTVG